MTPPYKIVPVEPGSSRVVDRATGEDVGLLLQGFHGEWTGRLRFDDSEASSTRAVCRARSRRVAAFALWAVAQEQDSEGH